MLNHINSKLINIEEEVITKEELLLKMIDQIYEKTDIIKDREDFTDKIMEREQIGTTGIGRGIVVPHARCEELNELVFAITVLKTGIEFNTPDDELAKVVILVGAPKSKNKEYLDFLSDISKTFRNKEIRDCVKLANSSDDIVQTLAGYLEGNS